MGCDVHGYLEYGYAADGAEPEHWDCLISNIGHRNYQFFSLLSDCGRGSLEPVFTPRGLPEGKLSWEVQNAMSLIVTDDPKLFDSDGFCSRAQAEGWGIIENDRVMHPDLHSHTWLTRDEFAQVIANYIFGVDATDYGTYGVEWDATLAAMTALEERSHRTRLIFAFDN